ncbi:biotin--[acetyl-CoA-carboxylase] ligase [Kroppenstedtia eburnea]|uniref:Bifunctional ligase/repressor BirA n=1 Tax=Kroppenstedtia eburnea TaxID=714067 RepID=A0A1N7IQJ7_9BACL|nr:biotin--[acetyl-CoA-carboxylase] ligase [Kroppenstedtia eburnea]QKI82089.1 biotin--[acetyl-CoA-carboxylase] ligase [Kroppenstedtia eburnea]SIS39354.1 BirA family transcriptional regulator, biotin operon repressor / biotin-[acetyl-CoA-carboxylase] ligase [Kroppenstedtia eburnea]
MSSRVREQLLSFFLERQDDFVSGEEISDQLQCSRTAIWKQIEELRKEGYQIEARPKRGYRLIHRPDRVAPEELKPHLFTDRFGQQIRYRQQVSSTQLLAHEWAREGAEEGSLVITEEQVQGRGRMGRNWVSPPRSGIWMSLILRPPIPLIQAPQLTLLTSVALTRALRKATDLEIRIKWPNDLLIRGRKICGILTETRGEQDQVQYVVVGMGINVNVTESSWPGELKKKATSLAIEGNTTYHRAKLIAGILKELEGLYDAYLVHGFDPIRILWEEYAGMLGRQIRTLTPEGPVEGTAVGLDPSGALLIRRGDRVSPVFSAEIDC